MQFEKDKVTTRKYQIFVRKMLVKVLLLVCLLQVAYSGKVTFGN